MSTWRRGAPRMLSLVYRAGRWLLGGTSAQRLRVVSWAYRHVSSRLGAGERGLVRVHFQGFDLLALASDLSMYLPLVAGTYEPMTARLFRCAVTPGARVLDVGANIGLYSVLAATGVTEEGRVVSVEPSSDARELLARNLARHGLGNVEVLAVAASDRSGDAILWRPRGSPGVASLHGVGEESERVTTARLDDLLGGETFDLVKVDIEGAEFRALSGMTTCFHPETVLVLEYSRVPDGLETRRLAESRWPHVAVIDDHRDHVRKASWDDVARHHHVNVVACADERRLDDLLATATRHR